MQVPWWLLLSLGCLAPGVWGQSYLPQLPGYAQWRASLASHARAEQRLEAGARSPAEAGVTEATRDNDQSSAIKEVETGEELGGILKRIDGNRIRADDRASEEEENINYSLNEINTGSSLDSFLDKLSKIFLSQKTTNNILPDDEVEENDLYDVVYSDETVRSNKGRVISTSEFDFDYFDTQETQKDNNQDFVSKELEQVQLDTKEIIKELEELVATVEREALDEKRLMTKTAGIIKKKLGTKSLKELINDEEFRNSIFHRFAVLKLPLRKEDISLAELSAVRKVVKKNILATVTETKSLLQELKTESEHDQALEERSRRLDLAKKQLNKLLEIL